MKKQLGKSFAITKDEIKELWPPVSNHILMSSNKLFELYFYELRQQIVFNCLAKIDQQLRREFK